MLYVCICSYSGSILCHECSKYRMLLEHLDNQHPVRVCAKCQNSDHLLMSAFHHPSITETDDSPSSRSETTNNSTPIERYSAPTPGNLSLPIPPRASVSPNTKVRSQSTSSHNSLRISRHGIVSASSIMHPHTIIRYRAAVLDEINPLRKQSKVNKSTEGHQSHDEHDAPPPVSSLLSEIKESGSFSYGLYEGHDGDMLSTSRSECLTNRSYSVSDNNTTAGIHIRGENGSPSPGVHSTAHHQQQDGGGGGFSSECPLCSSDFSLFRPRRTCRNW